MKKLFVTLADRNYIDRAKQVFSSAYFNSGWDGDFMLLAVDFQEEDTRWFQEKGILVYRCAQFKNEGEREFNLITANKFQVFKKEFKKWDFIVYVDVDVIVQGSLNGLVSKKGFYACVNDYTGMLSDIIYNGGLINHNLDPRLLEKMRLFRKQYRIQHLCFASGAFFFSTDIIQKDSFEKLCKIFNEWGQLSHISEMLALNLYFYRKWKLPPVIYHVYLPYKQKLIILNPKFTPGIILHFPNTGEGSRPWIPGHSFYKIWTDNLRKAEDIDLQARQRGKIRTWHERFFCGVFWYTLNIPNLAYCLKRYVECQAIVFLNSKFYFLYIALSRIKRKFFTRAAG